MRLTRDEIYVVLFILAALLVGAATKHYRHSHRAPLGEAAATPAITRAAAE